MTGDHDRAELPLLALRPARAARAAGDAGARSRTSPGLKVAVGPARVDHAARRAAQAGRRRRGDGRVRGGPVRPLRHAARAAGRGSRPSRAATATGSRSDGGPRAVRLARARRRSRGSEAAVARARAPPPPLRRPGRGARRRDRGVARVPVPLHVLREGRFRDGYRKRAARGGARGARPADRAGRPLRVLHRRDLPPRPRAARGARAARRRASASQLRIDNWSREMLDLLGAAGCVSIEAGVESITPEGRSLLEKRCKLSTAELARAARPRAPERALRAGQPARRRRRRSRRRARRSATSCGAAASGPTIRCRCSRTRARPTTGCAGARPTTGPGSARSTTTSPQFERLSDVQDGRPLPLAELEPAPPGALSDGRAGLVLMTADTRGRRLDVRRRRSRARSRSAASASRWRPWAGRSSAAQRREAEAMPGSSYRERAPARVDGRPLGGRRARGRWLRLETRRREAPRRRPRERLRPRARSPSAPPTLAVAHSCVLSW